VSRLRGARFETAVWQPSGSGGPTQRRRFSVSFSALALGLMTTLAKAALADLSPRNPARLSGRGAWRMAGGALACFNRRSWSRSNGCVGTASCCSLPAAQYPTWPNTSPVRRSEGAGGDTRPATRSSRYSPAFSLTRRYRHTPGQRKDHANPPPAVAGTRSCRGSLSRGPLGRHRRGAHRVGRPPNDRDSVPRMGPGRKHNRCQPPHCRRRARTTPRLPPLTEVRR
jgi:hypothetical protein